MHRFNGEEIWFKYPIRIRKVTKILPIDRVLEKHTKQRSTKLCRGKHQTPTSTHQHNECDDRLNKDWLSIEFSM